MEKHETIEKINKLMWSELCDIAETGKLSAGALEIADKAAHTIKSLETIKAMLDADWGYSGARGRTGRVKRDSMGRYSRDDGMTQIHDSNVGGGYSYDANMSGIINELRQMMDETQTPQKREAIRDFIHKMES